MSKYTLKRGLSVIYLCDPSGFYVAKSHGTSKEDYDTLQTIADKLNEADTLRASHAELVKTVNELLWMCEMHAEFWSKPVGFPPNTTTISACGIVLQANQALFRAKAITSIQKPSGGDSRAIEGQVPAAHASTGHNESEKKRSVAPRSAQACHNCGTPSA